MPNLQPYHIGMFYDNNPTVTWENRLTSKRPISAGRLLRALELRQRWSNVSPLLKLSIEVEKNDMSDVASQDFQYDKHNTLTTTHPHP